MSFEQTLDFLGREVQSNSLRGAHVFLKEAGNQYVDATGQYAPLTILYSLEEFLVDLARRLSQNHTGFEIASFYKNTLLRTYSSASGLVDASLPDLIREYERTIIPLQHPGTKISIVNNMPNVVGINHLRQRAHDLIAAVQPVDDATAQFEEECQKISESCKAALKELVDLRSTLNKNIEDVQKVKREIERVRNSRISIGIAVLSLVIAVIALITRLF